MSSAKGKFVDKVNHETLGDIISAQLAVGRRFTKFPPAYAFRFVSSDWLFSASKEAVIQFLGPCVEGIQHQPVTNWCLASTCREL